MVGRQNNDLQPQDVFWWRLPTSFCDPPPQLSHSRPTRFALQVGTWQQLPWHHSAEVASEARVLQGLGELSQASQPSCVADSQEGYVRRAHPCSFPSELPVWRCPFFFACNISTFVSFAPFLFFFFFPHLCCRLTHSFFYPSHFWPPPPPFETKLRRSRRQALPKHDLTTATPRQISKSRTTRAGPFSCRPSLAQTLNCCPWI